MKYKLIVNAKQSDGKKLKFKVEIHRENGGDFIMLTYFEENYSPEMDDKSIEDAILKRAEEFINVDAASIAKEELDVRTSAIATSLDGRILEG